jgi:iron complex transport system ATP-binding protein
MRILRDLADNLGKTIIIVVHEINFASCYSDYIVALKDGKIAKEGHPYEIIDKEVLEDIYEMEFRIEDFENYRVCIYF